MTKNYRVSDCGACSPRVLVHFRSTFGSSDAPRSLSDRSDRPALGKPQPFSGDADTGTRGGGSLNRGDARVQLRSGCLVKPVQRLPVPSLDGKMLIVEGRDARYFPAEHELHPNRCHCHYFTFQVPTYCYFCKRDTSVFIASLRHVSESKHSLPLDDPELCAARKLCFADCY